MIERPRSPGVYESRLPAAKAAMMRWEDYSAKPLPYIVPLDNGKKKITGYGASHVNTPRDLERIRSSFEELNPDFVFIEGWATLAQVLPAMKATMGETSEESLLKRGDEVLWTLNLALKNGVNVESPEPTPAEEVAQLRKHGFADDMIFAFYFFRTVSGYVREKEMGPVNPFAVYMENRVKSLCENLLHLPYSLERAEELSQKIWGEGINLKDRDFYKYKVNPAVLRTDGNPEYSVVNEVNTAVSTFRNNRILERAAAKLETHNRGFIVYGATHIVMLEPAFRVLLGTDQS